MLDSVVLALRPVLEERGFRRIEPDDGWCGATFGAGVEAVRVGWDADLGAVTLEAREPECGGAWTDMALKPVALDAANDDEVGEVLRIFREELAIYFTQIHAAPE